ncbi:MAG: hypothetical protein IJW33_04130, partial [Lentisphaeria bacterium]|nr:hypothetical protein [Lentisphaeria bacterium]
MPIISRRDKCRKRAAPEKLPSEFFGCGGVAHFDNFQYKLRQLLRYGFPHHMSLSYGDNFTAVEEAFYSYLNY